MCRYLPLDRIPIRAMPRGYAPKAGVTLNLTQTHPRSTQRDCCFSIACGERIHTLAADTPREAGQWIDELNRAFIYWTQNPTRTFTITSNKERLQHREMELRAQLRDTEQEGARLLAEERAKYASLMRQYLALQERATGLEAQLREKVTYSVLVYTGSRKGAGTSAGVYVTLVGTHGRTSGERALLKAEPGPAFRKGSTEKFVLDCGDLGDLTSIIIGHNNSGFAPSWCAASARISCLRASRDASRLVASLENLRWCHAPQVPGEGEGAEQQDQASLLLPL